MALLYPCTHIKNTLELPPGESPPVESWFIHPPRRQRGAGGANLPGRDLAIHDMKPQE